MDKKTKTMAGVIALIGVVGVGGLAFNTFAHQGNSNSQGTQGQFYSEERHEAMGEAFANKDYETWKETMEDRVRATDVVTEENFDQFAQMHELMEEGNFEEAREIREELGLGGHGRGNGRHMNGNSQGRNFHANCPMLEQTE